MIYVYGFLLLLASWLQPLHFLPWVSWHGEVLAFFAVLMLAWSGVARLAARGVATTVSFPVPVLYLVGVGMLIGVQWWGGLVPFAGDVFVYWAYLSLCVASICLGYLGVKERPEMIVDLASVVLVAALVSGSIALLQRFELSGDIDWI